MEAFCIYAIMIFMAIVFLGLCSVAAYVFYNDPEVRDATCGMILVVLAILGIAFVLWYFDPLSLGV